MACIIGGGPIPCWWDAGIAFVGAMLIIAILSRFILGRKKSDEDSYGK